MRLSHVGVMLVTLVKLATSSALPRHDLTGHKFSDSIDRDNPHRLHVRSFVPDNNLIPRMDVMDPGDVLPGKRWTMTLVKFISFVGPLVDTVSQAQIELQNFYRNAFDQLMPFPTGAKFNKPVFFRGELLSMLIKRESGTEPMTSDMVRAFLAHMTARLAMGGYRGIYIVYLRQKGGPGMFSAKLQSNPYWEAKGIENLPGAIGLAAMGF